MRYWETQFRGRSAEAFSKLIAMIRMFLIKVNYPDLLPMSIVPTGPNLQRPHLSPYAFPAQLKGNLAGVSIEQACTGGIAASRNRPLLPHLEVVQLLSCFIVWA
jgi:hypothetical protein